MFNAGIPFHISDKPELQTFVSLLVHATKSGLASYSTPNRRSVAGKLLNKEYEGVKNEVFDLLFREKDWLTLVTDGWSNQRRQPVMN